MAGADAVWKSGVFCTGSAEGKMNPLAAARTGDGGGGGDDDGRVEYGICGGVVGYGRFEFIYI